LRPGIPFFLVIVNAKRASIETKGSVSDAAISHYVKSEERQ
jgi:hypothetical protein